MLSSCDILAACKFALHLQPIPNADFLLFTNKAGLYALHIPIFRAIST